MKALELSEPSAFGGRLNVRDGGFDLTFYFPGPDLRYNGTLLKIDSAMFHQYLTAWEENWRTYQTLRQSMPSMSFAAEGTMGMRIDTGGVSLRKLRVTSEAELAAMLEGFHRAHARGTELQSGILKQLGRTGASMEEKLDSFARFKAGQTFGRSSNPAVIQELRVALDLVRSKFRVDIHSCRHHVRNWFGRQAAEELMADIRAHGLDVFNEQADFVISWRGRN